VGDRRRSHKKKKQGANEHSAKGGVTEARRKMEVCKFAKDIQMVSANVFVGVGGKKKRKPAKNPFVFETQGNVSGRKRWFARAAWVPPSSLQCDQS